MDYGLWFPIYVGIIKPERKCVGFRLLLGLLFGDCPNVVGLNQCIERVWSVSGFILHSFSLSNSF